MSDHVALMILDHSLRRRIAREIVESSEPVSLAVVSQRLDEPLSRVSYQGRVMAEGTMPAITCAGARPSPSGPIPLYEASKALVGLYPLLAAYDRLPPAPSN